jgi:tryptophan synthase alpha chain
MSLKLLFEQLREVRTTVKMPLVMMGYLNPIMQYGFEKFCQSCLEVGIDGMIIPDLPFSDYLANYKEIADRHDLKMIMLVSPETEETRIRLIDEETSGFIYLVSSASTTGAQQAFDQGKQDYFTRVAGMKLRNPLLVGFGISNKETLEAASAHTNGAIVGSKFIQLLGECATPDEAVKELLQALKA